VSRVLAGNGIIAWLTRADAPTPAVSYAVVHKGADAGIMITASHNAPRYNGVKLKTRYGAAASRKQALRVEAHLEANQEAARGPNLIDYQQAIDRELIRRFDPAWPYYEHLGQLVDLDIISNGELRVVADPMYGSGRRCIREMLARTRAQVQEIRGELNPGFGGIHPEPIARYQKALASAIRAGHGQVGIATDGDGDRVGAMDEKGNFVDPHHIYALVLRYLVEKRGWRGAVVKTVSTTMMINRLAEKYGLPLFETPVGFNHIADLMLNGDILIGGEESGGISIKGHIPEGDGVLIGLLLLELVAHAGIPLSRLIADIQSVAGPTCYIRNDLRIRHPVDKREMVDRLTQDPPNRLAGVEVAEVLTTDGIKYRLADQSWLLIRPSGTEPVLRVYAEAPDAGMVQELIDYGKQVAATS
jgi:phosphomannomutase